ncbi:type II toxin-antitoxin system prevent-host-death family antitoxin [Candidatus Daviesbacteria bacterium]|nr:type II toxin-antitoxin system prevent-host-death family antitoxin [Candidatus Daviesbacteria bacterium]
MTLTVSISELRNNLAQYLERVTSGTNLLIRDGKKNQLVAELVGKKEFNTDRFEKALQSAAGVFTAKNHPEWTTKKDVIKWLEKTRLASERIF